MLHWLNSLLPNSPHCGFVLVFVAVFLSNIGVPLPAKTILLGAGFLLGKGAGSLWQPLAAGTLACFLGGLFGFWLGRRLGHAGLEKIRWLHLTPQKMKRFELFFKRHGAKAVFFARFVPFLPPVMANLLAGMTKMSGRIFFLYNLAGSAACVITYTLTGYFFGQKWKFLTARLGSPALGLILGGLALLVLGVVFRSALAEFWARCFSEKRRRKLA